MRFVCARKKFIVVRLDKTYIAVFDDLKHDLFEVEMKMTI